MRFTNRLKSLKTRVLHSARNKILTLAAHLLGWTPSKDSLPTLFETPVYEGRGSAEGLEKIHKRFLVPTGWVQSRLSKKSVDREGNFLPWITYPSISFLEKLPLHELKILEFGAGASTLWFSERSAKTVSIETDDMWHSEVERLVGDPSKVLLLSDLASSSYQDSVETKIPIQLIERDSARVDAKSLKNLSYAADRLKGLIGGADLIFLDGGPRNSLLWLMREFSPPSAILLVDNSDSKELARTMEEFNTSRYLRISFWGLSPINAFPSETSMIISYDGLQTPRVQSIFKHLWNNSTGPQFFG